MELQMFIQTALREIVGGIAAAQKDVKELGVTVGSVSYFEGIMDTSGGFQFDTQGRTITRVEFDIALSEGSAKDTKGGIGVLLAAVSAGTHGASHRESGSNSRIKFAVPVVLP